MAQIEIHGWVGIKVCISWLTDCFWKHLTEVTKGAAYEKTKTLKCECGCIIYLKCPKEILKFN